MLSFSWVFLIWGQVCEHNTNFGVRTAWRCVCVFCFKAWLPETGSPNVLYIVKWFSKFTDSQRTSLRLDLLIFFLWPLLIPCLTALARWNLVSRTWAWCCSFLFQDWWKNVVSSTQTKFSVLNKRVRQISSSVFFPFVKPTPRRFLCLQACRWRVIFRWCGGCFRSCRGRNLFDWLVVSDCPVRYYFDGCREGSLCPYSKMHRDHTMRQIHYTKPIKLQYSFSS